MSLRKLIEDIKSVRIQGARNIALAALRYITSARQPKRAARALLKTRPTEPMLKNAMRLVITSDEPRTTAKELVEIINQNFERTVGFGGKILSRYEKVMTICHSSTVIEALRRSSVKTVYASETRPLYQGHKTARDLKKTKHVVFYVDSAMAHFMPDVEAVVIGADAIDSSGAVYNKIGSLALAVVAKEFGKPFYVIAESMKFDIDTVDGGAVPVEERPVSEVWSEKGITVRNPAFDRVPAKYIAAIVSDLGVLSPSAFVAKVIS